MPVCGKPNALDYSYKYSDADLRELWGSFGDICINDDEEIEEDFLGFVAGTSRYDIWHWFDEQYSTGLYCLIDDMYEHTI